jgi:large subunit ribosomal protein L24
MLRIKKDDEVIVISGKDKGRRGPVLRVLGDRVVIEGVNVVKKHVRPNPNAGVTGGIVDREMSIHVSNVMMYNPIARKGDRVGFRRLEDGRKVRYFKSDDEVVDV